MLLSRAGTGIFKCDQYIRVEMPAYIKIFGIRTAICVAVVFFLCAAAPAWSAEGAGVLDKSVAAGNAAQASFLDRFVEWHNCYIVYKVFSYCE